MGEIDLNGIRLKNEIIISSVGYGIWDWYWYPWPWIFINAKKIGAVITKTLTWEGSEGNFGVNPKKPKGMRNQLQWLWQMWKNKEKVIQKNSWVVLNCFGLWNPGVGYYFKEIYPKTKGINKIISIAGDSIEEYRTIIKLVKQEKEKNDLGIVAIELNLDSCPSAEKHFEEISHFQKLCKQVKQEAGEIPLILKLSPKSGWLKRALIAEKSGFNAIHAINSYPVSRSAKSPLKSEIVGQSGHTIKERAKKIIAKLVRELDIPVIGGGGVSSKKDVQEFLDIGASAINITTLCYIHPLRVVHTARKYRRKQNKI